jgi:molybdenum cofactor cytidylyltransferase
VAPPFIAAVVLAAGGAARLGQPKQLLPLAGRPLLAHAVDLTRDASFDLRYIVLGHASDEIRSAIDLTGFHVIVNPEFPSGQSTSVRRAVDAVDRRVGAIVFLLGDQPGVPPDVIERIIASYRGQPAAIIQPRYVDGPGNPVLIGREMFDALRSLTGDTGARPLLTRYRDRIRFIDVSEHERPDDIDTWDDYRQVRRQMGDEDPEERP